MYWELRTAHSPAMRCAVVAWERTQTNVALARAGDWLLLTPPEAARRLAAGDMALARLDVRESLDGIEDGVEVLGALAARGVIVLNEPAVLLATHDKLLTARLLDAAGIRHPRTRLARSGGQGLGWEGPVVVKPRFGSWGRDVVRCSTPDELGAHLASLRAEPWFRVCGAIVQELVPPQGYDLRLVVARGTVVGAVMRVAAAGEWRTNVALGARRVPFAPTAAAIRLALAAAEVVNGSLVGVDLLPDGRGGFAVIEVNGTVDFTEAYRPGGDVFAATAAVLAGEPEPELGPEPVPTPA